MGSESGLVIAALRSPGHRVLPAAPSAARSGTPRPWRVSKGPHAGLSPSKGSAHHGAEQPLLSADTAGRGDPARPRSRRVFPPGWGGIGARWLSRASRTIPRKNVLMAPRELHRPPLAEAARSGIPRAARTARQLGAAAFPELQRFAAPSLSASPASSKPPGALQSLPVPSRGVPGSRGGCGGRSPHSPRDAGPAALSPASIRCWARRALWVSPTSPWALLGAIGVTEPSRNGGCSGDQSRFCPG